MPFNLWPTRGAWHLAMSKIDPYAPDGSPEILRAEWRPGGDGYVAHFGTCKHRDKFKKKKAGQR